MTPGSAERSCSATRLRHGCTKSGRRSSSRSAKNSAIGFMSNGALAERFRVRRQRELADLDLAARAPRDHARGARARQPLDRVESNPARGLRVALLELLDAAAGRDAAHHLVGHAERVEHLEHEQRDVRRLDDVAAGVEHDVRGSVAYSPARAAAG